MPRRHPYTVLEAARHLGITRAAVHKAIRAGRLRAHYKKITLRTWLIDPTHLYAYRVSATHQLAGKKL